MNKCTRCGRRQTTLVLGYWLHDGDDPPRFVCDACWNNKSDSNSYESAKYATTTPVPQNAASRKATPICTGVVDYFPDALLEIAKVSRVGNDQHNPGQPLHWAKEKSTDEADALLRHLIDRGKLDSDGMRHSAKVAWRALALLQREIEAERNA